jgi:hypothetical protein
VSFTASGVGTGTGTVTLNVQGSGKTVAGAASGSFTYTTTTSQTFAAVTVLTGSVTVSTRYNLYMAGTADNYIAGNVGVGVAPSAWANYNAIQVRSASLGGATNGLNDAVFASNMYYDGTNYKYIATAQATQHRQVNGQHQWLTAASGTAGNNITFTQAMTLDASGRLGIGTTSTGAKLEVAGGVLSQAYNFSTGWAINAANTGTIDTDGAGLVRFYSRGANTSTKGSFTWRGASSDGSLDAQVMRIDAAGNVVNKNCCGYRDDVIRNWMTNGFQIPPTTAGF